jgi:hypothetical protein
MTIAARTPRLFDDRAIVVRWSLKVSDDLNKSMSVEGPVHWSLEVSGKSFMLAVIFCGRKR